MISVQQEEGLELATLKEKNHFKKIRGTGRLAFSSSHKYLISENFKESSVLQVGFRKK